MLESNCIQDETLLSAKTYKTYKWRFVISILYVFAAITNSVMWVCVSPIQTNLMKIYNLDLFIVNLGTSLIYLIVFIPISFLSNYIIDKFGLRVGFSIGCFLTIAGLWTRTFAGDSFYFIFAGQAIGAIGAPFILNTPQKISAVWYPSEERALSTTLLSIASPIGVGIGFFMAHLFVEDTASGSEGKSQVVDLLRFTAIVGTSFLAPSFLLMREKPPTAPSRGAEKKKFSYKESLKSLANNRNYLTFLAGAAFLWGTYSILATVMNPLIAPFGYTSTQSGIYGGIVLLMGMIGSPFWGIYVGKTKKYKQSLLILSSLSTLMLSVLLVIGPYGNVKLTGLGIGLYGFFTTPMLAVIFELCCEITFPVAEENAGGLTYTMTQAMGVVGTLLTNIFLNNQTRGGAYGAFVLLIIFQCIGVVSFFVMKEDLRRARYEQSGEADIEISQTESEEIKALNHV